MRQVSIPTRELFSLNYQDAIVHGTYHKVDGEQASSSSRSATQGRTGVLFINSTSPTRAGAGDSTVYWADSFSALGYPSFRIDLPGFGDSDGDPPANLLHYIDSGNYAPAASSLAEAIVGRFGLSGVIIVGLCSGAVSAVYTAGLSKHCKGLILIDPYFHLPLKPPSKLWQKLTGRISRTAAGHFVTDQYHRFKAFRISVFRNSPPSNANFALLRCWKEVASNGMPILIFRAPGYKARGAEFDYNRYIVELAGPRSQLTAKVVEGAGHTFSDLIGRTAIRQHAQIWFSTYFPIQPGRRESREATALTPDAVRGSHVDCLYA